jgi:hypothetical protein
VIRALALLAVVGSLGFPAASDARPRCAEDAPCWAWSTMGNHLRGIVLDSGRRIVVGPCRFVRLDAGGRIDWTRTPRLKGDGRGCGR